MVDDLQDEFNRSLQKPPKDKTLADFLKESGCEMLNSASKPVDTITAVNKFNLLTAKIKGLDLVGHQEGLREFFKKNGIPGAHNILKVAFKVEDKARKKKDDTPEKYIPPELWPDPVDGGFLLSDMKEMIKSFIVFPEILADTIVLFIMASYFMGAYDLFPILHITSPIKGCGKSKLAEIVEVLISLGHIVTDPSSAALFRIVDKYKASIIIDEVQDVFKKHEDVQAFCVASYRRKNAEGFMRCTKEGEVETYSAWGPKVLAGIGNIKLPALSDRLVRIPLEKRTNDEPISRMRTRFLEKVGLPLRRRLMRFAKDNMDKMEMVMTTGPVIPAEFKGYDRPAENFESLIAAGDLCGEEWGKRARIAAVFSLGEQLEEESSYTEELFKDIRSILLDYPEGIGPKELAKDLNELEDRPWRGWNKGDGIKNTDVRYILKGFKIKTERIRVNGKQARKYMPNMFIEVFKRYIPEEEAGVTVVTECDSVRQQGKEEPSQNNLNNINEEESSVTANSQNQGMLTKTEENQAPEPHSNPSMLYGPRKVIDSKPIKYRKETF